MAADISIMHDNLRAAKQECANLNMQSLYQQLSNVKLGREKLYWLKNERKINCTRSLLALHPRLWRVVPVHIASVR